MYEALELKIVVFLFLFLLPLVGLLEGREQFSKWLTFLRIGLYRNLQHLG
jgi:hypothetical protein